jgi:hypothetical protein
MQNILLASKPTTQWLSSSDFLALVELKLYTVAKCDSVVNFFMLNLQDSIPKHWKPTSTKLTGKDPQYSLEILLISVQQFKHH